MRSGLGHLDGAAVPDVGFAKCKNRPERLFEALLPEAQMSPARRVLAEFDARSRRTAKRLSGAPDGVLVEEDEMRLVDLQVFLCLRLGNAEDEVDIAWIKARDQGTGAGSRVLADLVDSAKRHDARLKAVPLGQADRLIAWYRRHGFARSTGDAMFFPPKRPA